MVRAQHFMYRLDAVTGLKGNGQSQQYYTPFQMTCMERLGRDNKKTRLKQQWVPGKYYFGIPQVSRTVYTDSTTTVS